MHPPPRAIHSRLLVHPRDDQRHRVALIDVPSEEDPLAEHVREWFLVFVHGREFPNKQTNKNKLCLLASHIHGTEIRSLDGLDIRRLAPPPLDMPPAACRARRALALAPRGLKHLKC